MPTYSGSMKYVETATGMSAALTYVIPPSPPFIEGSFTLVDVPEWAKAAIRASVGHVVTIITSGSPETLSSIRVG